MLGVALPENKMTTCVDVFIKGGGLTDCAFSERLAIHPAGGTPVHVSHIPFTQFDPWLD